MNDINKEKVILEEQKKLLDLLKQRLDNNDKNIQNTIQPLKETGMVDLTVKSNTNDTQKLIDKIHLQNIELQNIIDEKIHDIGNNSLSQDAETVYSTQSLTTTKLDDTNTTATTIAALNNNVVNKNT